MVTREIFVATVIGHFVNPRDINYKVWEDHQAPASFRFIAIDFEDAIGIARKLGLDIVVRDAGTHHGKPVLASYAEIRSLVSDGLVQTEIRK